jgi:hypothetical protein
MNGVNEIKSLNTFYIAVNAEKLFSFPDQFKLYAQCALCTFIFKF